MKKILREILFFNVHPTKNHLAYYRNFPVKQLLSILFISYFASILTTIPSIIISKIAENITSINFGEVRNKSIEDSVAGNILLTMAFFGPLIEEVVFRLWLSLKKSHIIISLIIMYCMTICFLLGQRLHTLNVRYIILSIILGSLTGLLVSSKIFKNQFSVSFKYLYWASCLGFGILHVSNFFPLELKVFWVYPFLIMPQLTVGFILGFSRIKYGFFFSLLLHCLINLPASIHYLHKF